MADAQRSRVPVAPNASDVRGTLVQTEPGPNEFTATWELVVDEAHDIAGLPNFVQPHVGERIRVSAPRRVALGTGLGPVAARIAFRGDERGGGFVVIAPDASGD